MWACHARQLCALVLCGVLSAALTTCESSGTSGNPGSGDGGVDTSSSGDADSDVDGDTDTDADTDSDTDSDTDADTDVDTDGDSDTETDTTDCVDQDSDGWCLPWDCNDSDSDFNHDAEDIPGNGIDEDCDGVTDDADDTGSTDVETESSMGPGTDNEYDPDQDNSDGVGTDPAGWLILNTEQFALKNLWIANEGEGTVSKVDVELVAETGRYNVGLSTNPSPSRTSVDLAGDVFVGNRKTDGNPASVTKIAADPERCVDRNGNGTIETSTGGADVFPRSAGGNVAPVQSTDECVVWTRSFDAANANNPDPLTGSYGCLGIRAMAATAETGNNFEYNGHVWVGCRNSGATYKLNGNNGDIIDGYQTTNAAPYGFALDSEDRLWIVSRDGGATDGVYWLNTTDGTMHSVGGPRPYGVAIDNDGHIWVANLDDGGMYRYTPGAPPDLTGGAWHSITGITDRFRGVAVDKWGYVWAIRTDNNSEVYLIDPALFPDPSAVSGPYDLADATYDPQDGCGIAVDFAGHVWGVSDNGCPDANHGCATRLWIDRDASGTPTVDLTKTQNVPVGRTPYSYSDMIGYHLRNFTTKEGWYRQTFEVCPGHSTKWNEIEWESDLPVGTSFIIRARTADYEADLASATWFTIVEVPSDTSPKILPPTLPEGHFIELEVRLYTPTDGITPKVGAISFDFDCTGLIS